MKNSFLLFILCVFIFQGSLFSQSVAGEWYGVGSVNRKGEQSSYLAELELKQKGNKVTGLFNYYFKREKIVSNITGTYDPKTRTLEIKAAPILNYKAKNSNGADCPMEGSFTLISSQVETILRGQFNPIYDYRYTCPAINIKFKKGLHIDAPPIEEMTGKLVDETPEPPKPVIKPVDTVLQLLNKRSFDVVDIVDVYSDTITATLYDNSEIDNDTVSMFYNKNLIAYKKMLSDKPITFKLAIRDTGINEISMYAENLGSLPPNTGLLIVMDGERRLEFNLLSTYIKNSTIRFRKKKVGSGKIINQE